MLYAADMSWWSFNAQEALKFEGIKATSHDSVSFSAVSLFRRTGDTGYDPEPGNIRTGGNSGYQAIHIAIQSGAERILLLGFDMTQTRGAHWHGEHPYPLRNTSEETYKRWISRFDGLNGHGSEIVNCTPGSALGCFPHRSIAEVLNVN